MPLPGLQSPRKPFLSFLFSSAGKPLLSLLGFFLHQFCDLLLLFTPVLEAGVHPESPGRGWAAELWGRGCSSRFCSAAACRAVHGCSKCAVRFLAAPSSALRFSPSAAPPALHLLSLLFPSPRKILDPGRPSRHAHHLPVGNQEPPHQPALSPLAAGLAAGPGAPAEAQ